MGIPMQLTIDELIRHGWPTYLYRFDHFNTKGYDKVPPVPFRGKETANLPIHHRPLPLYRPVLRHGHRGRPAV